MKDKCLHKILFYIIIILVISSCNNPVVNTPSAQQQAKNSQIHHIEDSLRWVMKRHVEDSILTAKAYALLDGQKENLVRPLPQNLKQLPLGEQIWEKQNYSYISKTKTLKSFALNIRNDFNIPFINDSIRQDIIRLRSENPYELKLYISLVLLKIYKSHLICCNQSYDLGGFDSRNQSDSIVRPIVYEFVRIMKKHYQGRDYELILSSKIYYWIISEEPELIRESLIKKEVAAIARLLDQ